MSRFSDFRLVLRVAAATLALAVGAAGCASAERPTLADDPAETDGSATDDPQDSETDETGETGEPQDGDSQNGETDDGDVSDQQFPNVIEVNFSREGVGPYTFDVTISSPYDTPERYADAWRVVGLDGVVFGTRELTHDHQSEQPFTRSLNGVVIPGDVTDVVVEARDSVNGWGGGTVDIRLDPAT